MKPKQEAAFALLREILKEASPLEVDMVTPKIFENARDRSLAGQPLGFGLDIAGPWVAGVVGTVLMNLANAGAKAFGERLGQGAWASLSKAPPRTSVTLDPDAMNALLDRFTYEFADAGLNADQCSRLAQTTTLVVLREPELFQRLFRGK